MWVGFPVGSNDPTRRKPPRTARAIATRQTRPKINPRLVDFHGRETRPKINPLFYISAGDIKPPLFGGKFTSHYSLFTVHYPLPIMSEWLEHSVQVEVAAPIEHVWDLWHNIELMPCWMKWIESVNVLEDRPELSRWKLATGNLEFSWLTRILQEIPYQIIQWESVDGLPNRGAIRFYDRKETSIVKLTVAYAVPGFLAVLMDNGFVRNAVEGTLNADMERFKAYALKELEVTSN